MFAGLNGGLGAVRFGILAFCRSHKSKYCNMAPATSADRKEDRVGEDSPFHKLITKWLITKAREAVEGGIPADEADIGYKAFKAERKDIVNDFCETYPAEKNEDRYKKLRRCFYKNSKRFKDLLKGVHGNCKWMRCSCC